MTTMVPVTKEEAKVALRDRRVRRDTIINSIDHFKGKLADCNFHIQKLSSMSSTYREILKSLEPHLEHANIMYQNAELDIKNIEAESKRRGQ